MKTDEYGAWPETVEELSQYIESLTAREHDYETSAQAMADAAVAAFNFIGHALGTTGFQAGWAELQFIKTTRHIEGPFAILDGENLLYPQYDLRADFERYMTEWPAQLAEKARELLTENENNPHVARRVRARWQELAANK